VFFVSSWLVPSKKLIVLTIAVLTVVLLTVDAPARPVQLALDSRPLARREFTAGSARAGFIQPDLRLPSSESGRLDSCQFAAANTLSNALSLILLAVVDSLRKAGRRDYDGQQRRHREPFRESLHW
jgi:hypothetical protein